MNASAVTSQSANHRLNRIQLVSRIFRALIIALVVLMSLMTALFLLAAVKTLVGGEVPHSLRITFSPHQVFTSPFAVPLPVLLIGAVQLCLGGCGLILLNRLFKLYEQGHFFTLGNIRCLKFLGLITLGIWMTTTILEFMAGQGNVNGTGLIIGILIVFIAWIMDEGRKIQEEQALTV
jgi:hypothetical protein